MSTRPEPDLRCYHHPEREATSQCDRCGDYLCGECVNEHDELYVCDRCLKDIRPRIRPVEKIGIIARFACVVTALACGYWMVVSIQASSRGFIARAGTTASTRSERVFTSSAVLLVAFLLSFIGMPKKVNGERLLRWSLMLSAVGYELDVMSILAPNGFSRIDAALMARATLMVFLTSFVLLGASAWKGVKPTWAVLIALCPLLFFVLGH